MGKRQFKKQREKKTRPQRFVVSADIGPRGKIQLADCLRWLTELQPAGPLCSPIRPTPSTVLREALDSFWNQLRRVNQRRLEGLAGLDDEAVDLAEDVKPPPGKEG